MKKILFILIITSVFFIVSCARNSSKTNEIEQQADISNKTDEIEQQTDVSSKTLEAIINSDCGYYSITNFNPVGNPVGTLTKGQHVFVLEPYFDGFKVHVRVRTIDGTVTGYVLEEYLDYLDGIDNDFWFKNLLLTMEYYYTDSVEYIFANSYGRGKTYEELDNDERRWTLSLWRKHYSQIRMRITDHYFSFGDNETLGSYRLESVKKNGNTYTLRVSDHGVDEYEVTLLDSGDSITITRCIIISGSRMGFISFSIGYKYVPYDEEKAEETKNAVYAWCDERLEILRSSPP
jgi:hypothetical protein